MFRCGVEIRRRILVAASAPTGLISSSWCRRSTKHRRHRAGRRGCAEINADLAHSYVGCVLRLTLLAPEFVESILDGGSRQGWDYKRC
jgi:hypothetical protein